MFEPVLESERIAVDGLVVNLHKRVVTKNGAPVKLTPKEFDLLAFLTRHSGRPLMEARQIRSEICALTPAKASPIANAAVVA